MTTTPLDRFFAPVPRARVAVLRLLVYLFVPFDMLLLTRSALSHAELSADLYQPVLLGRLLHVPAPTPLTMRVLCVAVIVAALLAAFGRSPRIAGGVVAVGYLWWVLISMSYGKVDHDHLALIVALFVLPTAGRARWSDRTPAEAAGWALRGVQIAVVATYFLSAWAKMRIGGPGWASGETLRWALERRGTALGRSLTGVPMILYISQWVTLAAEFGAPLLLFSPNRLRYPAVAFFAGFHAITYVLMTIHFLPHVICLAAFLPLERLAAEQALVPRAVRSVRARAASAVAGVRSAGRRESAPAAAPGPPGTAMAAAGAAGTTSAAGTTGTGDAGADAGTLTATAVDEPVPRPERDED